MTYDYFVKSIIPYSGQPINTQTFRILTQSEESLTLLKTSLIKEGLHLPPLAYEVDQVFFVIEGTLRTELAISLGIPFQLLTKKDSLENAFWLKVALIKTSKLPLSIIEQANILKLANILNLSAQNIQKLLAIPSSVIKYYQVILSLPNYLKLNLQHSSEWLKIVDLLEHSSIRAQVLELTSQFIFNLNQTHELISLLEELSIDTNELRLLSKTIDLDHSQPASFLLDILRQKRFPKLSQLKQEIKKKTQSLSSKLIHIKTKENLESPEISVSLSIIKEQDVSSALSELTKKEQELHSLHKILLNGL